MRVTDLAYSRVQEPPPDDDPPPDGTPPPVPTNPAPQAPETAPVLDSSVSPVAPSTQRDPGAPQNAASALESYGSPKFARPSFTHGFPGSAFIPQPDGTLCCPAGHPLSPQERRPERNGSLRVLYAARIGHCRPCPLRAQCQESDTTLKPRRVSAVFWPHTSPPAASPPGCVALVSVAESASPTAGSPPASSDAPSVPAQPVRWGDWPRCQIRRAWVQLLRTQTVLISLRATETLVHTKPHSPPLETRAERAHWRLSWDERLARNARLPTAPSVEIVLHGLPASFIQAFDFPLQHIA
jgi:hypothetical protein